MQAAAENEQTGAKVVPPILKNKVPSQASLDFDDRQSGSDGDPDSVTRFDLFTSPSCNVTLVFLGVLMVYGVADSMPLGESYTSGYPYLLFVLTGLCVAGIVWAINSTGQLPRMVAAGLMFVGATVGVAVAHPALLRANAWTDSTVLQQVEYVRTSDNRFEPVAGDWPRINMIGRSHWQTMQGEVRRTIPIRRGGLGFYQADLTNIKFELEMSSHWSGT